MSLTEVVAEPSEVDIDLGGAGAPSATRTTRTTCTTCTEGPEGSGGTPHAAPPASRSSARLGRPFRRLWAAAAVSSVGDGLALVAFPLLAASLTTRPALVAGVLAAERLPWLLLGLHAGALVDRLPRLPVMAAADLVRAVVVIALGAAAALGVAHLALVYGAAFLMGALETVHMGASHAALPEVVDDDDDLEKANGYLMAAQTGGEQLAGPAAGGLVFAAAAGLPFLVDGATYLLSAVLVAGIALAAHRAKRQQPAAPAAAVPAGAAVPTAADPAWKGLGTDVREGLRCFWSMPSLRLLAVLVAGLACAQARVLSTLVLFALDELGLSGTGYGVFLGVTAIGNVAGSLAAARLRAALGAARLLSGAAAVAGAAYLAMAATSSPIVAAGAATAFCVAVAAGSVASVSLRQRAVPAAMLGRVGNAFRVCIWGVIPLGALAGGVLAGAFGLRTPLVVAGTAQLLLAVATRRRLAERLGEPPVDVTDAAVAVPA